jgi:hypothetical protein
LNAPAAGRLHDLRRLATGAGTYAERSTAYNDSPCAIRVACSVMSSFFAGEWAIA